MDINNYSYAPYMLEDADTPHYFGNDDMYCEITKQRLSDGYYAFWIYATSYDGSFEYSGRTENESIANDIFHYIVDKYATTPPESKNIDKEIEILIKEKYL